MTAVLLEDRLGSEQCFVPGTAAVQVADRHFELSDARNSDMTSLPRSTSGPSLCDIGGWAAFRIAPASPRSAKTALFLAGKADGWACVGMRGHAWACVGLRGPGWAPVGPAVACFGAMSETASPPPVTLITGPEELLVERALAAIVGAARAVDPDADLRRMTAPEVEPARLRELTSPSLFGESTILVIDSAHELAAEAATAVARYIREPADHVVLVLIHSGASNRAKAILEACKATRAPAISCPKVTRLAERVDFVRAESRAAGRAFNDDAARALVDAVGSDLRELSAACAQLICDTEGTVTPDVVTRYFAGRAEVTSFQVADLAMDGRTSEALKQLRFALGCGVAPVLVTSALAASLRSIGRVASAPRGARPADLARDLGMPPWKVDVVRRQMRGWNGDALAEAIAAVATADGAVKGAGGAGDPGYALEKAVVQICQARGGD